MRSLLRYEKSRYGYSRNYARNGNDQRDYTGNDSGYCDTLSGVLCRIDLGLIQGDDADDNTDNPSDKEQP